MRRAIAITVGLLALGACGAALGYGVSTIILRPGHCVKVAKTRVCAAKVKPVLKTITVTATSRPQLDELYRTLTAHPMVKIVL